MYVVGVQAHYDSAHVLRKQRGRCERLHGHRYVVEAALAGDKLATVRAGDKRFRVRVRIDTPTELDYYRHGGILKYVVRHLAQG